MADIQEVKKINIKSKFSSALKDLIVLCLSVIFVFILSYFFNVFIFLNNLFRDNPRAIGYIDEIITGLVTLSIGLAIFAWRRWLELKKETAFRIKKQEELLEMAETKADVERIISKQLRSDMDQLKQEVKEIHYILHKKPRL